MKHTELNFDKAKKLLPKRDKNGHKGTFGRAFAYVGSKKFPGAAHLAIESLLRGGCGYTELFAENELADSLIQKFPEVIYNKISSAELLSDKEKQLLYERSLSSNATLIGSGSGCSKTLSEITETLISLDTPSPIIIDADALNSLALYSDTEAILSQSKRCVILTPHEMEFSRLTGLSLEAIKSDRVGAAEKHAKKCSCVIILKGHNTVITDGNRTYINPTGTTALSKGGSGDTLAGLMTSLIASSDALPLDIAALACYIHGLAGDNLSEIYSDFGVTPSDLPREIAKIIRSLSDSEE